jgi:hypothetical protein
LAITLTLILLGVDAFANEDFWICRIGIKHSQSQAYFDTRDGSSLTTCDNEEYCEAVGVIPSEDYIKFNYSFLNDNQSIPSIIVNDGSSDFSYFGTLPIYSNGLIDTTGGIKINSGDVDLNLTSGMYGAEISITGCFYENDQSVNNGAKDFLTVEMSTMINSNPSYLTQSGLKVEKYGKCYYKNNQFIEFYNNSVSPDSYGETNFSMNSPDELFYIKFCTLTWVISESSRMIRPHNLENAKINIRGIISQFL